MDINDDDRLMVRASFRAVAQLYGADDEDPDMPPVSWPVARDVTNDSGGSEFLAWHIIERAKKAGVLLAACEDIADRVGSFPDDDDCIFGLKAVIGEWHRVADLCGPTSSTALLVRSSAEKLRGRLNDEDVIPDYVNDLLVIATAQDRILQLDAKLHDALGRGNEEQWWRENGAEALQVVATRTAFLHELRARGEEMEGWAEGDPTIGRGRYFGESEPPATEEM